MTKTLVHLLHFLQCRLEQSLSGREQRSSAVGHQRTEWMYSEGSIAVHRTVPVQTHIIVVSYLVMNCDRDAWGYKVGGTRLGVQG